MKNYELYIKTQKEIISPAVLDKVKISMEENGSPAIMSFSVVITPDLGIDFGNVVTFKTKTGFVYVGYIFSMKPKSDEILELRCYDSLRYLKNKGSYVFQDESYTDILKKICSDHGLPLGEVDDTKYKLPGRVENDKEFWEILMNASKETTMNTSEVYVLYDKGNKIYLKNRKDFTVDSCIVNMSSFIDYNYEGSIDENTYNSIYIKQLDDTGNEIKNHTLNDDENIEKWGLLQYYAYTTEKESSINDKMKNILKLTNRPTRKFTAKGVVGDSDVRAGCLVPVFYELYDYTINGYMVVASVVHEFESGGYHMMDLTLYNIDIMPAVKVDGIFENNISKEKEEEESSGTSSFAGAPTEKANKFISLATQHNGKRYVWGATGPNTFDCSGLVTWGLRQMGILGSKDRLYTGNIPTSSLLERIPVSQAQPGDLVWRRSGGAGHVAIYIGNGKTFEAKSESSGVGYGTVGNKYMYAYRVKEFYK